VSQISKQSHCLSLEDLRQEYRLGELTEQSCDSNPIVQFERWMQHAQTADLKEPNAMTLATATRDGRPSARIVLLKEVSENGFVFYTNYESRKGRELAANPVAALTFYWAELERQVRIEGTVSRTSAEQSEAYFRIRPKRSRLGALASNQSGVLASRKIVESRMAELEARYADTDDIPKPEYWGGYCLWPDVFEFWQGRRSRLHDRIRYTRLDPQTWRIERLAP
jgi:pyridoxamine 5'-phosphate oxidase